MKKLIFFLIITFSLASNANLVKNIVGQKIYNEYQGLIKTVIFDKNITSLPEIVTILKENGLIELFFNKPKLIHPSFIFLNNNPIFNTKTLYSTLKNLGYYYFYPSSVKKDGNYSITIEMLSKHHIDPVSFINEIQNFQCNVVGLKKENDFKYIIDCKNEILNVPKVTNKLKAYLNIRGEYFFDINNFKKISISTSKYDRWYPYIAFYDKNLNIIGIIAKKNIEKKVILLIPPMCKYIKIRDNFTKENIKRGIFIKGIQ